MSKKQKVVQFRGDEEIYQKAQERFANTSVSFPDVMRAALNAIAGGDVTPLADIINSAGGLAVDVNHAWLYQKCHEIFEYKNGKLLRKSRKGMGEQGSEAYIRLREGNEHVLIQGNHYPLKDIIWLMENGSINGIVHYKNSLRKTNKHSIENLMIEPFTKNEVTITKHLTGSEKINICNGKQRAISINTENDKEAREAIEHLINNGQTIPLLFKGEGNWLVSRTAIHAIKLNDNHYVLSIS